MYVIADNMEEKHHYRKRGVPNPYRASAVGLSSGRLKKVGDIIKLGGVMGAMGAFDPDDTVSCTHSPSLSSSRSYKSNDLWEYDDISVSVSMKNNKYAWRLNCEDGLHYGISPEDYETKAAYEQALSVEKQKNCARVCSQATTIVCSNTQNNTTQPETLNICYICNVSRLDNGATQPYRTYNDRLSIGAIIHVPDDDGNPVQGVVVSIKKYDEMPETAQFDELAFICE